MTSPSNVVSPRFESLFRDLLETVSTRDRIRSEGATLVDLVEVEARLMAIRSLLAAERRTLASSSNGERD